MAQNKGTRIAIANNDRCKPNRCNQECRKICPVNRAGKLCIEVDKKDKIANISEYLCIGCGMCAKRCPFDAISIINIPSNLDKDTTHRYSPNSFTLHRLPLPRHGQVLGLVGSNGTGKSTALKILAGKIKPNFGRFQDAPSWDEIITYYRGSELQNYFKKMVSENLKAVLKPQYIDQIQQVITTEETVQQLLDKRDARNNQEEVKGLLELEKINDREVGQLSGGELQRFAIAMCAVQEADIYMFDEPSSYLDIKQRLNAAKAIRSLLCLEKYVVVVEHDLAVLDFLSDFICCLYGSPGVYGVATMPMRVREGINIFLDGYIPTENLRFRETSLTFRMAEKTNTEAERDRKTQYHSMTKTLGNFTLHVEGGDFTESEIVVLLGENGTGKTTFIRLLAGKLNPDEDERAPKLRVSYKPQKISPKSTCSVRELLHSKIREAYVNPEFVTDVMKPLNIPQLFDEEVQNLSGGEVQRVAIALCLGQPADVYLLDEPSAYLDSEQRIHAAKVIKRFVMHNKKTAFVVEHDFIMATYLADRIIVFDGDPGVSTTAHPPRGVLEGVNTFLEHLDITIRRDPSNFRPRINKMGSVRDREQKQNGTYFFLED